MPDAQEQGLYGYFLRELDYLRTRAKDFALDYPRVAEELKLSHGKSSDPHVELLLQSFAYLSGSVRRDMDSEASLLPNQLLQILYPHLAKPIPSMMVVQPEIIVDGANFEGGYRLEQGREFYVDVYGSKGSRVRCTMRSCYATVLRPLVIDEIAFVPVNNFEFDSRFDNSVELEQTFAKAHAVLKVHISNGASDPIHSYGLDSLRFYINGESNRPNSAFEIYSLLANDCFSVAVLDNASGRVQLLSKDSIRWLGFNDREAVLPYQSNSMQAYRILQEYFAFPEKFLFFEIDGIVADHINSEFEILFLLNAAPAKSIKPKLESLQLNSIPLINLFQTRLKPLRLDETDHEYRLEGDVRNHAYCEIHSVVEVSAIPKDDRPKVLSPYIGVDEKLLNDDDAFYSTRIELSPLKSIPGTDTYIAFHKGTLNLAQKADDVISVLAWCTNRRLPESLRVGDKLNLLGAGPINVATITSKPTIHRAPNLNGPKPWRLISNLSLNYMSLQQDGIDILKSILLIYSDGHSKSHYAQIDSIKNIHCRPVVKQIGLDQWRGFCRGTDILITLDEEVFDGGSILLFGEVLSRFLGLYANVNSFTQLKLAIQQRKGIYKTWAPLAGEQIVL